MTTRRLAPVAAVLLALLAWWFTQHGATTDPAQESVRGVGEAPSQAEPSETVPAPGESGPLTQTGIDAESGLPWVAVAALPPEAADTLALIEAGGPYPHDEDDETFFNREGLLPDRGTGYYREYTVETPGLDHRGARRIVTGAEGEYYWTDDHYESFSRIDLAGSG